MRMTYTPLITHHDLSNAFIRYYNSCELPLFAQSRRSLSLAMLIPRKEVITQSLSTGDGPQLTEWPFNAFSQSKGMDEPSQLLLRMKQIHRAPVRKRPCG